MDSFWTHLLALLLVDVAYYTVHRTAHEINWLWVQHSIHHSSEHYNLSTALRYGRRVGAVCVVDGHSEKC